MAKILIIDDARFMRRVISRCAASTGNQTIEAGDGKEGLELFREERPDLIILDLVMPDMDGFEVLEALSSEENVPPVIVLTADIQHSIREKVIALGASAFLNKPPNEEELAAAINAHLSEMVNS